MTLMTKRHLHLVVVERAVCQRRKHRIEVPDWIWEWAQRESGIRNPAPLLRYLLQEAVFQDIGTA